MAHSAFPLFFNNTRLTTLKRNCPKQNIFVPVRNLSWYGNVLRTDYRLVTDPKYNKGLGFTHEERQQLNVLGLFPGAYRTIEEQLYTVYANFQSKKTNLDRYLYIKSVRARQERLYFRFLSEHIVEVLPVVYTPTVGAVCQAYSSFYNASNGIYVTKHDKGHMRDVLTNWPEQDVRAVCVTDGERILGLGDLGANGMGISIGKIELYTALAKIPPDYLLPAMLDVGTNNKKLLCDPMYIGVREERTRGEEYDELVQEFVDAIVDLWGQSTLIHFEDFATPNAFKFIRKYQGKYCFLNDDIQGTAACGVAGFLACEHITKTPLQDQVFMFVGAGSAGVGIASLLVQELISRKLSQEQAVKNIYITDVDGLITKCRKEYALPELAALAKDMPPEKNLEKLVETVKPSVILGATGQGGIFNEKILKSMASNHKRPTIIACSNPTNRAECTAEQAYTHTEGRALFASGSPFPPVTFNGKRLTPTQANNSFAFPGIALAVMYTKPRHLLDEVYLVAAKEIARIAIELGGESLYPPVSQAPDVAFKVGMALAKHIIDKGQSTLYPLPQNLEEALKSYQYFTDIESAMPPTWCYPEHVAVPIPKVEKVPPEA